MSGVLSKSITESQELCATIPKTNAVIPSNKEDLKIEVSKSQGTKCPRCWKILDNKCERCEKVIKDTI